MTMVVTQGEIRQSLAELMGIDATKGLFLLLSKNKGDTPIRCGVVDFRAHVTGVLTADRIVLDTGVVLVTGTGDVDLRNENHELRAERQAEEVPAGAASTPRSPSAAA